MWCIPEADPAFIANMEDVLDLYEEPYDPKRPVVCFDETPRQLVAEKRLPLPVLPGQAQRYDYEYRRNGTCNLFVFFEPLAGRRGVLARERRTMQDFAFAMRHLVDELYPRAEVIRVVLDQLNTHTRAALYATFLAQEARRLCKKLEFHYTPRHGSWLNMAEIELSVFERVCLCRRMPDQETLEHEAEALADERNRNHATVRWQFRTANARIKLRSLYPSFLC